jgi:NTE family protein
MKRRALVLGGGGVIGVAWESGFIAGLVEAGLDVADADLIVGTSAGSIVGSRVAAGQDLSRPHAPADASLPLPEEGPDLESLRKIFGRWSSAEEVTQEFCAELGALALAARTASEEALISRTCGNLGFEDWPAEQLRIVTVDAGSGERVVHHAASGAPLRSAIAASCSVPGMFPPVSIGDRRYFDGGVHSGTNADLALEIAPDAVLVVAPICAATAPFGALAERCLEAESREIVSKGGTILSVLPGDADVSAFGPHLMDAARAPAAREAGRVRARDLAAGLADLWE